MNHRQTTFIRTAVSRAIETVSRGDARDCRLVIDRHGAQFPLGITIEICPPRHGCGWEQDSYWAHTNDIDLFAGTHGYSMSVAKNDPRELVDPVCEFIAGEVGGAPSFKVRLVFGQHPGQSFLPMLEGDSDACALRDVPEFNGI